MSPTTGPRVELGKAAEVCQRFEAGEVARALLRPEQTSRQLLDLLIERGEYGDAVRFLAHALPKPQAVWWGIQCALAASGSPPPPKAAAALAAAQKWLADPSDENRRAAMPAAQEAGVETAAGCVAMGVFLSGGSLGPASLPAFAPGEYLTARVVAGGVILAATVGEPERMMESYRSCIARGIEVANGASWGPSAGAP